MRKEAIGIAVNGREVKIAHVAREKNRLIVDFIESAILHIDPEDERQTSPAGDEVFSSKEEDAFSLKSSYELKESVKKETSARNNADALYGLLRKFAASRIKVAFNVPATKVSYQDLDTDLDYNRNVFKGTLRKKIEQWKQGFNAMDNVSVITRKNGTLCNVSCDTVNPPILFMLEQLNSFFKGNLVLSLMDPNELALVSLARNSYNFQLDSSDITVIIQIESEFSRLIFMKGEDLLTVSPIITEGFHAGINDIIYSKIIYELDNLNITRVTNILLASKASSNRVRTFFEQKFPEVRVGFIVSQPLAENLSSQYSREELSDYAIPIALAWKLVDKASEHFSPTNLLPAQIISRQKLINLTFSNYFLLGVLALSAFILTWQIVVKKFECSSLKKDKLSLQQRIRNSEETVKKVHQIEAQTIILKKRIALSDSLSHGSDRLLHFLENLNSSVLGSKSIWIEEISNQQNGYFVRGMALKRADIPEISKAMGGAKIKKLMRTEIGSQKIFNFEMDVDWSQQRVQSDPQKLPITKVATGDLADSGDRFKNAKEQSSQTPDSGRVINTRSSQVAAEHRSKTPAPLYSNKNSIASKSPPSLAAQEIANRDGRSEIKSNIPRDSIKKTSVDTITKKSPVQADPGTPFTVKISAHAAKITAEKERELFQSEGFETYITTLPNSSPEIPYWVCFGNFPTYQEASTALRNLNAKIIREYRIIPFTSQRVSPGAHRYQTEYQKQNNVFQNASHTRSEPVSQYRKESSDNHISPTQTKLREQQDNTHQTDQNTDANKKKQFTIRISAHAARLTAVKESEFYQSKGFETFITSFPGANSEIPYWVCYGHYSNSNEASEEIKKLIQIIPGDYSVAMLTQ